MTSVRPPGSKSLTNRALLLAGLANGESTLRHPLLAADDTERMISALTMLGASIERIKDGHACHLRVQGVGGRWRTPPEGITLNLKNAGTATRFLAAAAILAAGPIIIDGNARMRQRPIGQLAEALEQLGAEVEYLQATGHPPLRITPPESLARAPRVSLATTVSSQFISALLLVAPFIPGGLTLTLEDEPTSRSYVQLTLGLLDELGICVKASGDLRTIRIAPPSREVPGLPGFTCAIEPDASSATYFWAAAALFPGASCKVQGISPSSLQPDAGFSELLSRMGASTVRDEDDASITVRGPAAITPIMADMSLMPDAAMTLAAVACFAEGRSIIRGLHTLRHKETDRIAAVQKELTKIGVDVQTNILGDRDTLTITPPPSGVDTSPTAPRVEFDTYDDHRMAMSLALIALRRPNTFIRDPRCVAKTYPTFWRDFGLLYT